MDPTTVSILSWLAVVMVGLMVVLLSIMVLGLIAVLLSAIFSSIAEDWKRAPEAKEQEG